MEMMPITGMINLAVDEETGEEAVLAINNLLVYDFIRYATKHNWCYDEQSKPLFYTVYFIHGKEAINTLKKLVQRNPWFAFLEVDKYP